MRSVLFAAAAAITISPAAYGAVSGYDLCAFTTQIVKSRAKDFATFRGEMRQSGEPSEMKEGGAQYALTVKPGEDADCGILARGVDVYNEPVVARIFCTLGAERPFADATAFYDMAVAELRACLPRAKFNASKFGDAEKAGDFLRWSTEIEDAAFSLVVSMSALPEAGRIPADAQFTVRYQLWNMPGGVPAKRAPVKKAAPAKLPAPASSAATK